MVAAAKPIGIFDSGVGGLTVVRAISDALPDEPLLYLGDTARVPYGTKSPEVVERYALRCGEFLAERGAKALVIACNTASAVALEALESTFDMPVLGVIGPGARAASAATKNRVIGVIGTEGTIRSGRYQRAINAIMPNASIHARACPMLVPLAEEGLNDHAATRLLAEEYLQPLLAEGIDTLVLGCTHYPVLRAPIEAVCGPNVRVIDSATAVAESLSSLLTSANLSSQTPTASEHEFFATDAGERFQRVGGEFLGRPLSALQWVDL